MTSKIGWLCAVLFVGSMARAADEKPAPADAPLSKVEFLQVRPTKERFAGGEPVILNVVLLNKSTKTVPFLMLGPKFEFEVRWERKKAVLTYKGKDESKGDKVAYRSVAAGEKFEYQVVLSRLFDLSRAGNYQITCTKHSKNENKEPGTDLMGPVIASQVVKFAVEDEDVSANP